MNEEKMDELLSLMRSVVPDESGMSDAGKVGFVYKYDYDPAESYEKLDVVKYGMSLWTPKTNTAGNPPPEQSEDDGGLTEENEFWKLFLPGALGSEYVKKTDIAVPPTETEPGKAGVIIPDGKTITEDPDGTIHGASQDKVITNEEMQAILESGEAEDGTKAFVSGIPATGNQGILLPMDNEVKNSMNAVRNFAIKKEIDRLDGLIAEAKELKASLESFGMAKICPTETTSVTEDDSGLVLGAKEKNASVEGTLGNILEKRTKVQGVSFVPVTDYVSGLYGYREAINGSAFLNIDAYVKDIPPDTDVKIADADFIPIWGNAVTRAISSEQKAVHAYINSEGELRIRSAAGASSAFNVILFIFYQGKYKES